jgi:hypothetical protein
MPVKLSTTISKIESLSNSVNSMGIAIGAFQVAYIVLSALIIMTRDRKTG